MVGRSAPPLAALPVEQSPELWEKAKRDRCFWDPDLQAWVLVLLLVLEGFFAWFELLLQGMAECSV